MTVLMIVLKVTSLDTFRLFNFFDKSSQNLCPKPTFLVANDQWSVSKKLDLSIFQGENVAAFAGRLFSRRNGYGPR